MARLLEFVKKIEAIRNGQFHKKNNRVMLRIAWKDEAPIEMTFRSVYNIGRTHYRLKVSDKIGSIYKEHRRREGREKTVKLLKGWLEIEKKKNLAVKEFSFSDSGSSLDIVWDAKKPWNEIFILEGKGMDTKSLEEDLKGYRSVVEQSLRRGRLLVFNGAYRATLDGSEIFRIVEIMTAANLENENKKESLERLLKNKLVAKNIFKHFTVHEYPQDRK